MFLWNFVKNIYYMLVLKQNKSGYTILGDNMNEIAKTIGKHIKVARLNKRLSQEQLAEKCDVSTKYISALEVR